MDQFQEAVAELEPGTVAIVGIPSDENSSFMDGAALGPLRIREVLHSGATNLSAENGMDLSVQPRLRDLGDLVLDSGPEVLTQIEKATRSVLDREAHLLAIGGDHAISYPILRAYAASYRTLNVLHLDAHPDLYDEFEGNRFSHACSFARIMEENLATRLVQVGIRTMNPHQREQAERFAVDVIDMRAWMQEVDLHFEGPLYLSLDMDVLDPAFAPGVSHHEPGGLSTRDVLQIIHDLQVPIVGADIVEFNPRRDPVGISAMAAAKLLKEIAATMLAANAASNGEA